LRKAYDYWQDQPGCFSTEPKEQKQIEGLKSKQKHTNLQKVAKATNNKQNQATTKEKI